MCGPCVAGVSSWGTCMRSWSPDWCERNGFVCMLRISLCKLRLTSWQALDHQQGEGAGDKRIRRCQAGLTASSLLIPNPSARLSHLVSSHGHRSSLTFEGEVRADIPVQQRCAKRHALSAGNSPLCKLGSEDWPELIHQAESRCR